MPKKFNEHEKAHIHQKLLEVAKRSFETFGLKKTNVEDLTKACGIAQGSFYLFFKSKEELFYDLLQKEEQSIREKLLNSIASENIISQQGIRLFLLDSYRLMSESPLIRQMYLEGEFEQLVRKLPPDLLENNFTDDQEALMPVVRRWQHAGILRAARPELIVSMLRALILLSLHKKEIGEAIYTDTIELLVDVLAEGMFATSLKKE
ncbi:TetR family transcriptional regulator [Paenibacillus sp. Soil766]|uniref:TetR/AcrR family transcriptional regulator n=1 Tax=Paenibacillus sp. Soil766 TaxID=1736404 RepID=UPI00070DF602|nr:TetR/AcrR family transcriptional regulator [Paenibacillus sp. Soil766]KRE96450.1 TetR family transcriptional regulator [Paenibacillus sp. Soil766]